MGLGHARGAHGVVDAARLSTPHVQHEQAQTRRFAQPAEATGGRLEHVVLTFQGLSPDRGFDGFQQLYD